MLILREKMSMTCNLDFFIWVTVKDSRLGGHRKNVSKLRSPGADQSQHGGGRKGVGD